MVFSFVWGHEAGEGTEDQDVQQMLAGPLCKMNPFCLSHKSCDLVIKRDDGKIVLPESVHVRATK